VSDIEKRARELLAAEYVKEGRMVSAEETMHGHDLQAHAEYIALRAIIAALTPPEGCALAAAARAALPFIAYAFDQRVDGAEQAGRAIEAALQTSVPEGYVLVPVAVAKDAERYQWLRAKAGDSPEEFEVVADAAFAAHYGCPENLDMNVDAAMLASRPEVLGG
jgi:hypothetical protein